MLAEQFHERTGQFVEVVEHHVANERQLLTDLTIDEQTQLAALLRRLLLSLGDTGHPMADD
ncbi:hypothetical protein CDO52_15615 [Nocardiopsis gilva YIM 90087]|uniref:MarR family transcriptional regulator n=1 Tax=Nocardiopsis gilva YIM 90087 TaxID=1235441 RepID=A0A223S7C8_9ACTN|nr:hypothetical protein CDO52_15615 [Nocardiopsis gilva YIM 90087]